MCSSPIWLVNFLQKEKKKKKCGWQVGQEALKYSNPISAFSPPFKIRFIVSVVYSEWFTLFWQAGYIIHFSLRDLYLYCKHCFLSSLYLLCCIVFYVSMIQENVDYNMTLLSFVLQHTKYFFTVCIKHIKRLHRHLFQPGYMELWDTFFGTVCLTL